jgi:hypothetical protein
VVVAVDQRPVTDVSQVLSILLTERARHRREEWPSSWPRTRRPSSKVRESEFSNQARRVNPFRCPCLTKINDAIGRYDTIGVSQT